MWEDYVGIAVRALQRSLLDHTLEPWQRDRIEDSLQELTQFKPRSTPEQKSTRVTHDR